MIIYVLHGENGILNFGEGNRKPLYYCSPRRHDNSQIVKRKFRCHDYLCLEGILINEEANYRFLLKLVVFAFHYYIYKRFDSISSSSCHRLNCTVMLGSFALVSIQSWTKGCLFRTAVANGAHWALYT